jgi:hypothetical protein
MVDDSFFPPRCCRQPIITGSVRVFLTVVWIGLQEPPNLISKEFDEVFIVGCKIVAHYFGQCGFLGTREAGLITRGGFCS